MKTVRNYGLASGLQGFVFSVLGFEGKDPATSTDSRRESQRVLDVAAKSQRWKVLNID